MKVKIIRGYQELRKEEYPPIEEQLDMIYWDKVNETSLWEDNIKQIKDNNSKVFLDTPTPSEIAKNNNS